MVPTYMHTHPNIDDWWLLNNNYLVFTLFRDVTFLTRRLCWDWRTGTFPGISAAPRGNTAKKLTTHTRIPGTYYTLHIICRKNKNTSPLPSTPSPFALVSFVQPSASRAGRTYIERARDQGRHSKGALHLFACNSFHGNGSSSTTASERALETPPSTPTVYVRSVQPGAAGFLKRRLFPSSSVSGINEYSYTAVHLIHTKYILVGICQVFQVSYICIYVLV